MADVYCDQALGTGADNGTSWTDAYRLLATALDGINTGAGDTLWVKNNTTTGATSTFKGVATWTNDPPKVIGVIAATTATPPTASDIVPGIRNGSSTRAYDQTAGNAAPIFSQTTVGNDITIQGWFSLIYGIVLKAENNFTVGSAETMAFIEECEIRAGDGPAGGLFSYGSASSSNSSFCNFKNCKMSGGVSGQMGFNGKSGKFNFYGCVFDIPAATMIVAPSSSTCSFEGCDFSAQSGTIVGEAVTAIFNNIPLFLNCKINASSALLAGTISEAYRAEFIGISSATGKTTGQSFREVEIITSEGNIIQETTAVRTGGANDGASGAWALAFTPGINGTRDNYLALIGPWMAQKVVGVGTAQTLTVYIANSGAGDYNDDDVWLEVVYPSESGTAQYDWATSQMDLLATPAAVTDDTGSTWGTGGNNHQKLSASISPDYDGRLRWRVHFAKNFGAAPETLYVDPLGVLT